MGGGLGERRIGWNGRRVAFHILVVFIFTKHDRRTRLHGLGSAHLRIMEATADSTRMPAFRICRRRADSAAGRWVGSRAVHSDSSLRRHDSRACRVCWSLASAKGAWYNISKGLKCEFQETPQNRFASPPDRKSTRLNSSHGYISYAVFCLKNKNHIWEMVPWVVYQRIQLPDPKLRRLT